MEHGAKISYAFEIDKELITCMKKTFQTYKFNIAIMNEALSDKNGQLYYKPNLENIGNGIVSKEPFINSPSESYYKVLTTTLDNFCEEKNIKPDFIKMDIEGSEPDALQGSIKTFQEYRPKFAVCIYHRWEHRWEIPLLINSFLDDYNFYLKKSHPFCETVFFGIPHEKMKK